MGGSTYLSAGLMTHKEQNPTARPSRSQFSLATKCISARTCANTFGRPIIGV